MKQAKRSWHTAGNCAVRSQLAHLERVIRESLQRFEGDPITADLRDEMAHSVLESLDACCRPLGIKVTPTGVDGDLLYVDVTFQPLPYSIEVTI